VEGAGNAGGPSRQGREGADHMAEAEGFEPSMGL